jgi:transcriptional regulator of acetoin/glycerol metabolism
VNFYVDTFNREFKKRIRGVSAAGMKALAAYGWPGNIRELRNVIRGALAICEAGTVRVRDLPEELQVDRALPANPLAGAPVLANAATAKESRAPEDSAAPVARDRAAARRASEANTLAHTERDALLEAIRSSQGNLVRAARALGVSRNTLYRKLRRHRIVVSRTVSTR